MDIEAIKAKYLVDDVRDPAEWRAKFSRIRNETINKMNNSSGSTYRRLMDRNKRLFAIGNINEKGGDWWTVSGIGTVKENAQVLANSPAEAKKNALDIFLRKYPKHDFKITNVT